MIARNVLAGLALAAVAVLSMAAGPAPDPTRFVDPFIGTGQDGHTFPGATAPFGMVQLSPDTDSRYIRQSYKWSAGYRYEDSSVMGFSHTHFSGTGHSDMGDVLVMPISGEVRLDPGDKDRPGSGYRSRFSHADEAAEPGYYAVTLKDYAIRAELTASPRVGVHRYTFQPGAQAHVLLDMRPSFYDYPGKVLWSRIRIRPDGAVTGFRETRGWAPGRQLYFAIRFSQPVVARQLLNREDKIEYKGFTQPGTGPGDRDQVEGRALEAVFDFGKASGPILAKVSISPVSEDNALANLDAEVPGFDFDAVRHATHDAWAKALSVIEAEAQPDQRKMFYTALYHAMLGPTLFMDTDGRYRGPDNAVHKAEGFAFHSTFSLWDTFRAEHPLLTLVRPEAHNADFVRSLIASQQESPYGILPVWQFQGQETWTMIGYHAVPVIADAALKGMTGFDPEQGLKAAIASADYRPYGGLGWYIDTGYVPIDKEPEAASKTVEYAYDDWTIARLAEKLGHPDIAARFDKRALNYRNVFDTKTGFVRARKADGSFREPFDPTAINYGSDYTEGNAWQYSWFAPQDIGGLIALMGGDMSFAARLDAMFDYDNSKVDYSHAEDIAGLIGQYIHGNEPSHHVAYLYDHAGEAWRTQARLKQIMDSQYRPAPDGLVGNDDLGQMSAWYVFTALGFYPVTPGSGEYVIGRPFVERATLNLPNGRRFTMVAEGLSPGHPYVGRITLNGRVLARSFIRHDEIMAGGELRFVMRAQPDKAWAVGPGQRPYSLTPYTSH